MPILSSVLSHISMQRRLLQTIGLLIVLLVLPTALAAQQPSIAPIPADIQSTHFIVSINGRHTPVVHAASNYYLLNFDIHGPATIAITADDPHFWDAGVEVQPMRFGIRPKRSAGTITFRIPGPIKLSVSRPGEHFADSQMLFLFANPPEATTITAQTPGVHYFAPGVHHENIDARNGETIYLAPGAVVFGSLNIWQVHDVRVIGRGIIIHDGPQYPYNDEGWMHKPNWHCIVMDNATNIEINGITCITRSRTWQIQMKDSRHIGFYNIKVIGGNPNNANQDGMDWLGGGDTTVLNSFFRASDDVFALQGNWEGYELGAIKKPGQDVTNITIQNTIASTSISNTIRVGWPQKTFNSAHFHMSDVDVIHTGYGACKVPFAFFELWANPDGHGSHSDYTFQNIRLEDWYSLFQIQQPFPQIRDISFDGVWPMDGPAMVPPSLIGDVSGVVLRDASAQGFAGATIKVDDQATNATRQDAALDPSFTYTPGLLYPKQEITFTASAPQSNHWTLDWIFGDGTYASGQTVQHRFEDDLGTLLDGSGAYRVLLHATDQHGNQSWSSQTIALLRKNKDGDTESKVSSDDSIEKAGAFTHPFQVPADGGYTFTLLTSTKASLSIDHQKAVSTPTPRPQVCGSLGDAVQPVRLSIALKTGEHSIQVERDVSIENAETGSTPNDKPLLLWEGPGVLRQPLLMR